MNGFTAAEMYEIQRRVEDILEFANDPTHPISEAQRARRRALAIKIRNLINASS